ncbi:hypothetical protein [Hymenobacter tenuis]
MALELDLPTSRSDEKRYWEIENVLKQMRLQVESRYSQRIAVLLITIHQDDSGQQTVQHRYAVKLSFVYRNYTADLMELDCSVERGFPVKVNVFNEPFGVAEDKYELEKLIEKVFLDIRTRNIILINY